MTNKLVLAALVAVLASYFGWCLSHPSTEYRPATLTPAQTQAQAEHNAKHDALVARLAELNQIEDKINCPSFFDAPLGNKPCPAHELVEHGKAIIQEQLDAE
jgi:hypothetical protein